MKNQYVIHSFKSMPALCPGRDRSIMNEWEAEPRTSYGLLLLVCFGTNDPSVFLAPKLEESTTVESKLGESNTDGADPLGIEC